MSQKPIVFISGASRGLGAEAAVASAQLGANLVLTARSKDGLEATADRISELKLGTSVTVVAGDLSQPQFCVDLVQKVADLGRLDAVVLNAAQIEPIGMVVDLDEEEWFRCVELNLTSPFRLAKRLLPLLSQNQGRLITIGTGAATTPIASWSGYCTSKAALLMLTRVIAAEHPEVTAFSFAPGVVNTAMQQNIRERKELMPAQLGDYFAHLHSSGQLEPPEVPGRSLAWSALHAPREWSGQEIQYNDPSFSELVRGAFAQA